MKGFGEQNKKKFFYKDEKLSKDLIKIKAIKYHQQGDITKAKKYYKNFINKGFIDWQVFSNYGEILKLDGDFKDAEIFLRKAIDINPKLFQTDCNLGLVLINLGKFDEAEICFRRSIKTNSSFVDPYFHLGNLLNDLGKFQDAKIFLEKAIKIKPDFLYAFANLGNLLKKIGSLDKAEIYYEKAIEIDPTFAIGHYNLGNLQMELSKLNKAEISFKKAIEYDPDLVVAFVNLGNILKALGKLNEAEKSLRKAIAINPEFVLALTNLANLLKERGDFIQAEIYYEKALEFDGNYLPALSNLGILKKILGKLDEALNCFKKSVYIDPEFAVGYLNQGIIFKELYNLEIAENCFKKSIQIDPVLEDAHNSLGILLMDRGEFRESEIYLKNAISINSNFADAHSNLGNLYRDLGRLDEAEASFLRAIKINPILDEAYFSLSTLNYSNKDWIEKLFSKNLINQLNPSEKVNIFFARSNVLHRQKNYNESSKYLKLANDLKLSIKPSQANSLIDKTKFLFNKHKHLKKREKIFSKYPENIFIVGMPRCGSTLVESILSMNKSVKDLGETNIFEESFLEEKNPDNKLSLTDIYFQKINFSNDKFKAFINKLLYNYQYAGIIASELSNSKIIHCYRNPFDNILSIYRAHFSKGNEYSSSLSDCSRVFLEQEKIMKFYKDIYKEKIYDLNYDLLVKKPDREIKSLINWLGWEWNDCFLNPHLNDRIVSTASKVQVRSPINSKSVGGWKNYKNMLLEIFDYFETQ